MAALLELLRLFSLLYARLAPRPAFTLLFLLSSGGPFDFDGTRQVGAFKAPLKDF